MFKKLKVEIAPVVETKNTPQTVQARLVSETGEEAGPPIDLPVGVTVAQLGLICNALLENVSYIIENRTYTYSILNNLICNKQSGRTDAISFFYQ